MTCPPEERVSAYLAGELPPSEKRHFDEHLLSCEECRSALDADARAGRALALLREVAPANLQDRVVASVMSTPHVLADRPRRPRLRHGAVLSFFHRARSRRLVLVATSLVAAAGLVAGLSLSLAGTRPEPAQVAALVAMASNGQSSSPALRKGERMVVAGQRISVRGYPYKGSLVIVATSGRPFPVAPSSHRVGRARSAPSARVWMASKGTVSMYGVNHAEGRESMLVVAAMPESEMPKVVARLHLS